MVDAKSMNLEKYGMNRCVFCYQRVESGLIVTYLTLFNV